MNLQSITYTSKIDTIEFNTPISNIKIRNIERKGIEHLKDINNKARWKLNPSNYNYVYDTPTLSETHERIEGSMSVLTVINQSEVNINRIDICTDVKLDFNDNFKFIHYIHECIRFHMNDKKSGIRKNDNYDDDDMTNVRAYNSSKEIEFYNKKKQMGDSSLFDTRFEIRYKRVSNQSLAHYIDESIRLWQTVPQAIEKVTAKRVEYLYSKWLQEKQDHEHITFTMFVYKYEEFFYTTTILKEVYNLCGLKGSASCWLREYKKKHNIDMYTKQDVKLLSEKVIASLKDFKRL